MLAQRLETEELMDDPALPEATYREVLADLARVNRATLAYRPTLAFLERALAGRDSFRLLDVGYGQGDMLRRIAQWAEANGKTAELVGVDLNPNSAVVAREATPAGLPISYHTGDYADLLGGSWDVVVSSLVAHHMSREELVLFMRFMEAEARAGWFINDLHRHAVSYSGYPLLAWAARWHPIVRADGRTSIARSYRPAEWPALLAEAGVEGQRIERYFPFRLCVSKTR
ncbi:methyltransferase domain-containing protein [Aurantiacibacter luteus]|uniref:Methyltransferase type 12 n=1 Tax=Aurantiacibacter luteus TaxID=1581420 RepID=A0A0G9MZH4_9SPHN|nr:methyltransferase domain-containing protein [Aurantiacibacter luteus]KLE36126.1 methyltransferase type 12 [Aurantiacibacter luteus]